MGDTFKEQLVAMQMTSKTKMQRGLVWTAVVVLGLGGFLLLGSFFGSIIVFTVGWGGLYLTSKFKKEHEYAITNNELDIDVIYNKQTRKKVISLDLKKIDVMASIKDDKHKADLERAKKTIDASDGKDDSHTYAILYTNQGELTKILMTPNEDMLNLIYRQAPHKVMKQRY